MNYLTPIIQILTGIGSVGVFIGLFIAWKSGFLTDIWDLKKNGNGKNGNGKNGHDKMLIERFDALENNHLHTLENSIEGLRRDLLEHATLEIQLLTEIATLLKHGK